MSKLLVKFLASLLAFAVLFNSTLSLNVVRAQTTAGEQWYNSSFANWYGKVYDTNISPANEIFGERYTAAQVQWVMYGLWAFMVNSVTGPENSAAIACIIKGIGASEINFSGCAPPTNKFPFLSKPKPLAKEESLLKLVFAHRELSGVSYVREKVNNFSLVPTVKAQTVGFGFDALSPIQPMWKAVRDVSFSLFGIVAVVFSFMIMFRVKLSPQTVITVQSALPKLAMSLLMVTFSYAIAGLFIDLMYVVIGLISVIGTQFFGAINIAGTNFAAVGIFNFLTVGQPFGLNVQLGILPMMAVYIYMLFMAFVVVGLVNIGLVGAAIGGVVLFPLLMILGVIMIIVAIIVILWTALKTWWELMKSFVNIILLTILAPIQLTMGAFIPNYGFGAWARSYLSALSTFVVVGTMMLFCFIFVYVGVTTALMGIISVPGGNVIQDLIAAPIKLVFGQANPLNPFTGNANGWPPLLGAGGAGWIGLIFLGVSFVIFTSIPKTTDIVEAFIQGKRFGYGSAIGEAFGPLHAMWAGTGGAIIGGVQREGSSKIAQIWGRRLERTLNDIRGRERAPRPTGSDDRDAT
jgi:hypothetical protein